MRDNQNIKSARRFRRMANAPEAAAWESLRTLRKVGVAVRRQHPIDRFVVDFAIVKSKLVIETDGGVHRIPAIAARDVLREKELEALGWRLLRIDAPTALSRDHLLALVQRALGM